MRGCLMLFLMILSVGLHAQSGLGGNTAASILPIPECDLVSDLPGMMVMTNLPLKEDVSTCAPPPYLLSEALPAPRGFDFAAAKPYLAFFCRLELDIEAATKFPVRFRLGEVRTWQQELSKRD